MQCMWLCVYGTRTKTDGKGYMVGTGVVCWDECLMVVLLLILAYELIAKIHHGMSIRVSWIKASMQCFRQSDYLAFSTHRVRYLMSEDIGDRSP